MKNDIPKLYGLILSGGKSIRMGTDKSLIAYHNLPQREYLYRLMEQVCKKTFISLREEQKIDLPSDIESITDLNQFKGPFNGLLSAHLKYPDVAWLVVACDLPLIELDTLTELISQRDHTKNATAFALKENPLPEPVFAIWEPQALQSSLSYLQKGDSTCPRKFLINNDTKLVFPQNKNVLLNANSKEEYDRAVIELNK